MDPSQCPDPTSVDVIDALTPILTMLIGILAGYFPGLGRGKRTPRREEHQLREELERYRNGGSSSIPPPPAT